MKEMLQISDHAIGKVWFSHSPSLDYFHRHDELECNLVVSGRGSYIVQNHRIDLEENSIVWLFPEQEHLMINTTDDFKIWIIVIRPAYLKQSCTDKHSETLLEQNPTGLTIRHLETQQMQEMVDLCAKVVAAVDKPSLHNAILGHLVHGCWDNYKSASLVPVKQTVHPAIKQIAREMSQENSNKSLEAFAAEVGLTAESVSRLFKKQIGVTFSHYRNRCKLERFLNLYTHIYPYTMLEAAKEAGFGSYAQFYRVFCQFMEKTPSSYRQDLLKNKINSISPQNDSM